MSEYQGITYPIPLFLQHGPLYRIWRRFMCPHGWHLLDEVWSLEGHSLVCDACDLELQIVLAQEKPR